MWKKTLSIAALIWLAAARLAFAQDLAVSFSPDPPVSNEPLFITVSGTAMGPYLEGTRVHDQYIDIEIGFFQVGVPLPVEEFELETCVPALAPGVYTVRVFDITTSNSLLVVTTEVDVQQGSEEPDPDVRIFVQPEIATDNDLVRVIATGSLGCANPTVTGVNVTGDTIFVQAETLLVDNTCLVPVQFALAWDVGPLDAGLYRVVVGILEIAPTDVLFLFLTERSLEVVDAPDLALLNDRFEVAVTWNDFEGNTGSGRLVPGRAASSQSALFSFFGRDNWEVLVKVLDGCGLNDHWWVLGAAATNVEYTILITDTDTGTVVDYFNPLGSSAPAITDTLAFPCQASLPSNDF